KPVIFGFIIATVGCYYGLSAKGGTQGVGRATTQAVVAASVLILVLDALVTRLLMVLMAYREIMSLPPSISIAPASATAQPMNEAVVFEDVAIGFEDKQVLNGVSFQLPRGETKAVFGAAGSGKSTLLKLALGLLKPDRGQIYTLGQDIVHMKEEDLFALRSRVGIVFQESALFDSLTVRENVAFRLYEEGDVPESQIEERVREVLRFVELEHTLDKFPAEL